jgi:hypothetical protein
MLDAMSTDGHTTALPELSWGVRATADGTAERSRARATTGGRLAAASICLLLLACPCLLASCASVKSATTPYVGAPHFPPSDPVSVQIGRTEPTAEGVQLTV